MPASGVPWNSSPRFYSRFPQQLKPVSRPLVSTHLGAWKEIKFHNEYEFNLEEYMVELEQPIGLSLAPDLDGNTYVVKVHNKSSAHSSRVITEGDFIKQFSHSWGDWLTDCSDLKQIMHMMQKKRLKLNLLLERREDRHSENAHWHRQGKIGQASSTISGLLRPLKFMRTKHQEWIVPGAGKSMMLIFHRTVLGEDKRRPKYQIRYERAAMLRMELHEALALAAYDLSSPMIQDQPGKVELPQWKGTPVTVASNSVPYRRTSLSPSGSTKAAQETQPSDYPHEQRTKLVTPVLPWLLVTNTELTQSELVDLAGRSGLQCLLELQLEPCKDSLAVVGSCWKNDKIDGFVTALGTLHRLVKRREAVLKDTNNMFGTCSILLHCVTGMEGAVATFIAAYCFLYGWMQFQESLHFAQVAMQAKASEEFLHEVTSFLGEQAEERRCGVTVAWPYGGASVEVAGDLVGGWNQRSALSLRPSNPSPCQNTPPGTHFARIKGLQPGLYYYKFIVDGAWEVDYLGPKAMDESGNWNNILYVQQNGKPIMPTKSEDVVRVEAALVALRTKCD